MLCTKILFRGCWEKIVKKKDDIEGIKKQKIANTDTLTPMNNMYYKQYEAKVSKFHAIIGILIDHKHE